MPSKTVTLDCGTEEDAATVAAEAFLPGDLCNTARQDGYQVVITYTDKRYPLDVADWAFQNGYASDAEAANVIARL